MVDVITDPGLYRDIPSDVYHADPVPGGSLSSSGARRILPPGCPALFRWEQDHPKPATGAMELGTIAHKTVLGTGPELVVVKAEDWRTKKAQTERKEARARGAVPLLEAEYSQVLDMTAELHSHPTAKLLLDPAHGEAEQTIAWIDLETDVWRRAMIDWLHGSPRIAPMVVDYKTTVSASPEAIQKSVHRFGYYQQAPWYLDAVESVGYPPDTRFVFIFQEKTPPYLVNVIELDDDALRRGDARNRQAIELYRVCAEADLWPGYPTDIQTVSLPTWTDDEERS